MQQFKDLSTAEKQWVLLHPGKTDKAKKITTRTLFLTDSLSKAGVVADKNGGTADAFKHIFWISRMSLTFGDRAALKLGKAHEKGNFRSFKKGEKEDGMLPDAVSTEMDLFNNNLGAELIRNHKVANEKELIDLVLKTIEAGEAKIIKKDSKKNYLTCSGEIIPREMLKGKWENEKCLIRSNE